MTGLGACKRKTLNCILECICMICTDVNACYEVKAFEVALITSATKDQSSSQKNSWCLIWDIYNFNFLMSSRNLHRSMQNREAEEVQKLWLLCVFHIPTRVGTKQERERFIFHFPRSSWTEKFPLARHFNKIYVALLFPSMSKE